MAITTEVDANQLPFNLTDLDREILSQTDEEYVPHGWEELKQIIATNNLDMFKRTPSQLRLYLAWSSEIKAGYGSMVNYISQERLHWGQAVNSGTSLSLNKSLVPRHPVPFADSADYKILCNDWPYGCDPGIRHLVVWMKTRIPVSPDDGRLTESSKAMIDDFVVKVFVGPLFHMYKRKDQVLWFKNWTALQSVAALEHFHVLLRDVSEEMLIFWTGETGGRREKVASSCS
ncbi:hypothetical protein MMC17_001929 [Xylographa soralifera]|nr:hypothetical protein [Xylographa soralifera]